MKTKKLMFGGLVALGVIGAACSAAKTEVREKPTFDEKMVVGYYWAGASEEPDYDKVSVISLAFAHMKEDGTLDYEKLLKAKNVVDNAHAKGAKVIVSLRDTHGVSAAIANDSLRHNLAVQTRECIEALNLDGVDVDYEEWGGDDTTKRLNLEKFYQDIRGEIGDGYLLTAAVRAPTHHVEFLDSALLSHLDYVFPMIYDACGAEGDFGWGTPGQHSSYEYFEGALSFFVDSLKVSKDKICAGLPFYGYEFNNLETTKGGRGMPYRRILAKYPNQDIQLQDSIGLLWFNGIPTIQKKCRYVMDNDLAGVMIWELTQDTPEQELSLLKVINEELGRGLGN